MSDVQTKNLNIAIRALMRIADERLPDSAIDTHDAEDIAIQALEEMKTNGAPALLIELGFL